MPEPPRQLTLDLPLAPRFGREDLFFVVSNEHIANDAGALYAPNGLNLFEHAVVKVGPLRGDGEARRGGEFHRKDTFRSESRIDAVHVPPAPDEQTGADEQDNCERELRHDERATDSTSGSSTRDTSATLLTGGTQVAAQRRNRGRQSHQNSREYRDGQGPAEDAEIEAHFIQARQVAMAKGADETNAE